MTSKPTLIFVPGAWHKPAIWEKIIQLLEGYKCIPVTLPTTTSDPTKSFTDDFDAVRDLVQKETQQGNDVVLVVHSYGGAIGASAIKGFTPTKDSTSTGRVIGIASMASGFGPSGLTFIDAFGGKPPPSWKFDLETGYAVLVEDPRDLFYHDLPEDEGTKWVGELQQQSLKALTEGADVAYAGWKDVPVWYLMTMDDHALPTFAQQYMVQIVKDAGANLVVKEIMSSHSPMLSRPRETADFVLEALTAFASPKL